MRSLILCLLASFSLLSAARAADSCWTPSALWCDNDTVAESCGALAQCQTYNRTVFDKKIKLTLLYETLCPDCQLLITDVLYSQVWKYGKDFVDLELVPYGNARRQPAQNGTFDVECQHGPEECLLNKLHACAINQLGKQDRWFPFIYCMETALHEQKDPDSATKLCFESGKIKISERAKITDCAQGQLGDRLIKQMAERTESIGPEQHVFVPWILVNDVSTIKEQMYQNALFGALCSWYRGTNVPASCQGFIEAVHRSKCHNR